MKPDDFELLAALLKERSGLALTADKVYLLESRLTPIARKMGLNRLEELADQVRRSRSEPLIRSITEAMTTNESFFFRDQKPFDTMRDSILPALMQARAGQRALRIWCAACSTGQEPYSLAILLRELGQKLAGWRVEILGTDISTEVLHKAEAGIYSQFEVQRGLPIKLLMRYFKQEGEVWRIDPAIRQMVTYKPFNLLDSTAVLGKFDVIFCRNVLIYFDQPTKTQVLERISRMLPPDGSLFLGAAETVLGVSEAFRPVPTHRGVYQIAA